MIDLEQKKPKARYMVVYQTKKGNWKPANLYEFASQGHFETDDKLTAIRHRDHMASSFKEVKYAILELN